MYILHNVRAVNKYNVISVYRNAKSIAREIQYRRSKKIVPASKLREKHKNKMTKVIDRSIIPFVREENYEHWRLNLPCKINRCIFRQHVMNNCLCTLPLTSENNMRDDHYEHFVQWIRRELAVYLPNRSETTYCKVLKRILVTSLEHQHHQTTLDEQNATNTVSILLEELHHFKPPNIPIRKAYRFFHDMIGFFKANYPVEIHDILETYLHTI